MRELKQHELSLVRGGMNPISTFGVQHRIEPNHSSTFTAQAGPFHFAQNTGTGLSCYALGSGAAPVGGTIAAIGAIAARKPSLVPNAYRSGSAVTGFAVSHAGNHLQNQQFNH
jgi:hypothetical protein